MASFTSFTVINSNDTIEKIRNFAEENGYIIDLYQTGRLHMHKYSDEYFAFTPQPGAGNINIYGHTGFDPAASVSAQPGTSIGVASGASVGIIMELYATPNALYMTRRTSSAFQSSGGVGRMTDKLGQWAGGQFVSALYTTFSRILSPVSTQAGVVVVRKNEEWTPTGTREGAVWSTDGDDTFSNNMPFSFSAGVAPSRILVMQRSPNTNLFVPIGYAPDVRKMRTGDVYATGELLSIDGDDYQAAAFGGYIFRV